MSGLITLLDPAGVQVWLAALADFGTPSVQQELYGCLAGDEKQRADRHYFERHRQRSCTSRGLLRHILSRYCPAVAPQDWKLQVNRYGRPQIESPATGTPLSFNVSHSGDHLVVAVACIPELGVDVEQVAPRRHLMRIARRHFSGPEYQALLALPAQAQLSRFFDLWTLKEAYIKARGMGLALPLDSFSFGFPDGREISVEFDAELGDAADSWAFRLYDMPEARLALALKPGAPGIGEVSVRPWRITALDESETVDLPLLASSSLSHRVAPSHR